MTKKFCFIFPLLFLSLLLTACSKPENSDVSNFDNNAEQEDNVLKSPDRNKAEEFCNKKIEEYSIYSVFECGEYLKVLPEAEDAGYFILNQKGEILERCTNYGTEEMFKKNSKLCTSENCLEYVCYEMDESNKVWFKGATAIINSQDKKCSYDFDCSLFLSDCGNCEVESVNKNSKKRYTGEKKKHCSEVKAKYETCNINTSDMKLKCVHGDCTVINESGIVDTTEYDYNSWKAIIPYNCNHFSDGCNTCDRTSATKAICTKKGCDRYEKPKCLE